MAGREVREYTNLTDPKDKKWGKGKDKIDDEEIAFHRMVSKPWTVMTCSISRNRWKPRRTQNVFCGALKNVHSKHSRQQDLLKRVVEVKSKKPKVSNPSNGSNSPVLPSTRSMPIGKSDADNEEIETLPARPNEAGDRKIDNPVKSLLSVYDSSDDDDD